MFESFRTKRLCDRTGLTADELGSIARANHFQRFGVLSITDDDEFAAEQANGAVAAELVASRTPAQRQGLDEALDLPTAV